MMLTKAYVGLGSNLGDRKANIRTGLDLIGTMGRDMTVSGLYETTPLGFGHQPRFLNAVCRICTRMDAFRVFDELKKIEATVGSQRSFINGPRVLDLDLLVFGETVLESPGLKVPHPRIAERAFVLEPLVEIEPGLRHPVLKETVRSLLAELEETKCAPPIWRYSLNSSGRKFGMLSLIG